jgi:hypothetical protein
VVVVVEGGGSTISTIVLDPEKQMKVQSWWTVRMDADARVLNEHSLMVIVLTTFSESSGAVE